jgi:hypothetical protein
MRGTGYAASIRGKIIFYRVLGGKPEKGDILEDLGVYWSIILKVILKK